MRMKIAVCFAIAMVLSGLPVLRVSNASQRNPKSTPIDRRVDELLSRMTIEEKVGQLNQVFFFKQFMKPEMLEPDIRAGKIGSLLFVTDPVVINRFQK